MRRRSVHGGRTRRREAPRAPVALAGAALLLVACDRSPPPITEESLRGATYRTEATRSGTVTLEDGEYRVAAGAGAAGSLEIRFVDYAVADLDGDGREDAVVVLVEDEGFSGSFYRLHALLAEKDGIRDVASRLLGDRVEVRGVRIVDDLIAADLVIRAPGQPVSTPPAVRTTLGFALTDRGLFPIDQHAVGADRGVEPGTGETTPPGGDWTLSALGTEGGAKLLGDVARAPRLRFTPELADTEGTSGRLSGFAGCNRVFATYRAAAEGELRVSSLARTRRSCGGAEAELERLVTLTLETASGFALEDEVLVVRGSAADLRFVPAAGPPEDPLGDAPPAEPQESPMPVNGLRTRQAAI